MVFPRAFFKHKVQDAGADRISLMVSVFFVVIYGDMLGLLGIKTRG